MKTDGNKIKSGFWNHNFFILKCFNSYSTGRKVDFFRFVCGTGLCETSDREQFLEPQFLPFIFSRKHINYGIVLMTCTP